MNSIKESALLLVALSMCAVAQTADVSVTLWQGLAEALPNATNLYLVTVRNAGPDPATGVQIDFTLSPDSTFVPGTNVTTGSFDASNGLWSIDALAPGDAAFAAIRARVPTPFLNGQFMTCTVQRIASSPDDGNASNDWCSLTTRLFTNAADRTMPTLSISTPLGSSWPPGGSYAVPSGSVVTVTVSPSVVTQFPYVMSPLGWRKGASGNPTGFGTQAVVTVTSNTTVQWIWTTSSVFQADLVVTKTMSNAIPTPGSFIHYTLTVSNRGPFAATNVVGRDVLPREVRFISQSSWRYDSTSGVWTIGNLGVGAATTLTVVAAIERVSYPTASLDPAEATDHTQRFGTNIAVLSGGWFAVGASLSDEGAWHSGCVFLFDQDAQPRLVIHNPTPADDEQFGAALAAVGDNLLAVGSPGDQVNGLPVGAFYVFDTNGMIRTVVTNPVPTTLDRFGLSLAALGSNRVVVGSPGSDLQTTDGGLVHVFSLAGTRILSITNPAPAAGDAFGSALACLGTNRIAVGSPRDDQGAVDSGIVHVFSGAGLRLQTLTNPSPAGLDIFGTVLTYVGTNYLAVSAPGEDGSGTNAGCVHLYDMNGFLRRTLTPPIPVAHSSFGISLAAVDPAQILVGASMFNSAQGSGGRAYLTTTGGVLKMTFLNPSPSLGDLFGAAVAALGTNRFLVGAPGDTARAPLGGGVYVFEPASSGFRVDNTASATAASGMDTNDADNAATAVTRVGSEGDVAITLTQDLSELFDGETNRYTVAISNVGNTVMQGLRLQLAYHKSSGLRMVSTNLSTGHFDDHFNTWEINRVDPGKGETAVFMARATTNSYSSRLTTTVTRVTGAQSDADPANDSMRVVCRVLPHGATQILPRLTIVSPFGQPTPPAGTYTRPTGTIVEASIPPSGIAQEPYIAHPVGWRLTGAQSASGTNEVTAFELTGDTVLEWLWMIDRTNRADVVLTKAVDQTNTTEDGHLVYTLTVSNRGPDTATALVVEEHPSSGLTLSPAAESAYDTSSRLWNVGNLAPGATASLVLDAHGSEQPALRAGLHAAATSNNAGMGTATAIVGSNLFAVGAPRSSSGAALGGAVHLFDGDGTRVAVVTSPTDLNNDDFGASLAAIPDHGFVVGAPYSGFDTSRTGYAYFYDLDGTLRATLSPPNGVKGTRFGQTVAMLGTNTIVVGAPRDDLGANDAGTVYLFDTQGNHRATIQNPTPAASDNFGSALATSGTNLLAVGVPLDDAGATNSGVVHLFDDTGRLLTTVTNPSPDSGDAFGYSVLLTGDRLVAGVIADDLIEMSAGAVYVFSISGALERVISNPTPFIDESPEYFGGCLAPVGTGLFAVGAQYDGESGMSPGAVYVFGMDGRLVCRVPNPAPGDNDQFGAAIASDGNRLLVGGPGDDAHGTNAGSAYLYARMSRGGALLNRAATRTATLDPAPEDNAAQTASVFGPTGDAALALQQSLLRAAPGMTNVYSIVASNAGPTDLHGLRISIGLPPGFLTLASQPTGTGFYDRSTNVWELPSLPAGGSATLILSARVTATNGVCMVSATLTGAVERDLDTSNNTATALLLVGETPGVRYLTVASALGHPEPPGGANLLQGWGPITATVEQVVANGATQFVCTGWTLTGIEHGTGTEHTAVFHLTNDATLTWNWGTNYLLTILPPAHGTITGAAPGFHPAGTRFDLTATPAPGSVFLRWTGDTTGDVQDPLLQLILDRPRSISATFAIARQRTDACDFDGDGIADFATYLPSNGLWTIASGANSTTQAVQWGWNEAFPVPADYDGDGRADLAVYHPASGTWYIRDHATGGLLGGAPIAWGWSETVPAPADYDGDGIADLAVYHPASGNWYIRQHDGTLRNGRPLNWGWRDAAPVPADYDGDGRADPAVFHQQQARWYVLQSATDRLLGDGPINWGALLDVPVPGDYDGDGLADLAVYRVPTGRWFLRTSGIATTNSAGIALGTRSHTAVPGDYDGDGRTDPAVHRQATAFWSALLSNGGFSQKPVGPPGALPATSAATAYELWRRQR